MSLASHAVKRLRELYKTVLLRMRIRNECQFHPSRPCSPALIEAMEPRLLLAAGPILVDTFADVVDEYDEFTSLREAIMIAADDAGDDVIELPTGNYELTGGQLTLNDTTGLVTLMGVEGPAVLDGLGANGILYVQTGTSAELWNLTLTGGNAIIGGAVFNDGDLSIWNCTVTGNTAFMGGGIYNDVESTLYVSGSTFLENSTFGSTGSGGAIFNNNATMEIVNSTIHANTAMLGGGIYNTGEDRTATLTNVTITDNLGENNGGGVHNTGLLNLDNSILAGNTTATGASDLFNSAGVISSRLGDGPTNNLIESPLGHAILDGVDGNIVGQPALLDVLADNGGPTLTRMPLLGSRVINTGNDLAAMDALLACDQRNSEGTPRFVRTVDIGSVEADISYSSGDVCGQVWEDFNGDGVRTTGEDGLDGVQVDLYEDDGDSLFDPAYDALLDSQITYDGGNYDFWQINAPANYFVRVNVLPGYEFSPQGQDSDVDPATGASDLQALWPMEYLSVDAGLVLLTPEIDAEVDGQDDVHVIDFGSLGLNESATVTLTIRNEGAVNLLFSQIVQPSLPFVVTIDGAAFPGNPADLNLAPGEWVDLDVTFAPTQAGFQSNFFALYSNDPDELMYEIHLTGVGAVPQGEGYFELWGGNTDYRPEDGWDSYYYNIDRQDYTYIGGSYTYDGLTQFVGSSAYDYYVLATRAKVEVDSVDFGGGQYVYGSGDGNTFDWGNLYGVPDSQYTTVGYQGNSDTFCGFVIFENPGDSNGLSVYTGDISLPLHINVNQSASDGGTGELYLYEHGVSVEDQGWSTELRFQTPTGEWYDMWADDDGSGWGYWNESFTTLTGLENQFTAGWYTIEATGGPFGTTTTAVWFGDQDGTSPLAWPTQIPHITNIPPNAVGVPVDTLLEWTAVSDPNVTGMYSDVENADESFRQWFWTDDLGVTRFGPANLAPGTNYNWDLEFQNHDGGITPDGYGYHVARSTETEVLFRTDDGLSGGEPNLVMGEAFYTPGVYQAGDVIDMDFLLGNLGDGNAVAIGQDGLPDLFYSEVRLSFDPVWSADDVVIYRRGDVGWLGGEVVDTRGGADPSETWPGGQPTIPLDIERGNYYVLSGFDIYNQVAESDESDNLWVSETPNLSVETLVGVTQPKHVLALGVANPKVKFRGDVAAQRVHQAFEGMEGLVTNLLIRYNIDRAGNQQHLLDTLEWFKSRVLPGDQFIFYIASQACHDLEGNEVAVDAQYDTRKGRWNQTRTTTGDEYLYLSNVDDMNNWMSDDKLAACFFDPTWAEANKLFILDTPYAGGFIGMENPADESQWDLALLRFDPTEALAQGQTERTEWATGSTEVIAAAGEGQFAFMTPENSVGWAGVNRMGTHMLAPIRAQVGPEHDVFDIEGLFWQTNEPNSIYCNDIGMEFAFADGNPFAGDDDGDGVDERLWGETLLGGTNLERLVLDPLTGAAHVQLGADVKLVRYVEADGSRVTLRLNRGVADLTFLGENLRQSFRNGVLSVFGDNGVTLDSIQLIDTTENDTLTISVSGGDGYADLGQVTGEGSLSRLLAARMDLVGAGIHLTGDASIGYTRLHNIENGADVLISGAGPNPGVQFIANSVGASTDISFGGAVRTLVLNRWTGGSLKATHARVLRVRKDMGADVTLTGADGPGRSIVVAQVFGDLLGGAWDVLGAVQSWYVRGNVLGADLQFNGDVTKMFIGGGLIGSTVQLSDANTVRVVGLVDNSRVNTLGDIRAMIVGAMQNSTVFAGIRGDYALDANGDGVLDLPDRTDLLPEAGEIKHFQIRGMRGVANAFVNSNLAAGSFGSVRLNASTLENPTGLNGQPQAFGLLTSENGVNSLQLILNRKSYFWKDHTWTRDLNPQDLAVIDTV
ncbi:MAG: hypothetical protein JXA11_04480 [Phycisphaerae bacterium]|nr:hypothetical protein [Phycisphaerae bacterium]